MNPDMRREVLTLTPIVLFLTVALVGVMVISAYYVDSKGIISIQPTPKAESSDVE